jgi:four helix bundle protein
MLRIYPVSIDIIRICAPLVREIKAHDANLADHLNRAATNVALNIAEGDDQRDGNRRLRYSTALGEAREVRSCIDIGEAKGIVRRPSALDAKLDHIIGTLVNLTR